METMTVTKILTSVFALYRVATNLENMEKRGKLREFEKLSKSHGKLREIWTFVKKTWKTQGKWKICDMIANKNALIEFFSLELLREKV